MTVIMATPNILAKNETVNQKSEAGEVAPRERERDARRKRKQQQHNKRQYKDVWLINETKEGFVFHLKQTDVVAVLTSDWREAVVVFITMSSQEMNIHEGVITANIPEMEQASWSEAPGPSGNSLWQERFSLSDLGGVSV